MAATRPLKFLAPAVEVEAAGDGSLLLRSPHRLETPARSILVWLQHWAECRPGQVLLAERTAAGGWRRVTYAQGLAAVRSLATALLAAGASPERPLAVLSENSIEHALVSWAAMYAGVPVVPVSPAYALASGELGRLRAVVGLARPWIVFVQDGQRFGRALQALAHPASRVLAVDQLPVGAQRFADWLACVADPAIDAAHARLDPASTAKIMFTSGSTGVPKGVVMSHAMLAATQQQSAQILVEPPDKPIVQVDWLPWHHVMGGNVVLGRLLRFGGTLYLDDGRPLPGRFARTLANLRDVAPSYYFNVPAGYAMLVAEFERDPAFAKHMLSQLDFAYYSGAGLPADLHRRFQEAAVRAIGRTMPIGTAYAATETTAAVTMRTWAAEETACIGVPMPGCELKLIPDAALPGRFELRVRGPGVFQRYLNAPETTAAAFDDEGWYRLGDAVRFVDPARQVEGLLFAGRFAEDFKLGNGSWVRTGGLRTRLLAACAPLLREAVLCGEGCESVGALAWLDTAACREALGPEPVGDDTALHADVRLRALLAQRLAEANAGETAATLRIASLLLQAEPPSLEAYELTDKGSVNARAVAQRRTAAVAELHARPLSPAVIQPSAAI